MMTMNVDVVMRTRNENTKYSKRAVKNILVYSIWHPAPSYNTNYYCAVVHIATQH